MSRTRTVELDYDDLQQIRQRELGGMRYYDSDGDQQRRRRPRDESYDYRRKSAIYDNDRPLGRDYDRKVEETSVVPYNKNQELAPYRGADKEGSDYDRRRDERRARRRDYSDSRDRRRNYSEDESEESSRSRSRRHRRRKERKDRDRDGEEKENSKNKDNNEAGDSADEGLMFFSGKQRKHGNFVERRFDSSYEGITAGIAGGLIGAMTARRFGGEEHQKEKVIAGAVIGAAGFNAVENWYRIFTEDRDERKEEKQEQQNAQRNRSRR